MSLALRDFLKQYADLNENELSLIIDSFKTRSLEKNDYLLREGEVCRDIVFVETGCIRLYYVQDDIDISVWFSFNESSAIEIHSFISEIPSGYFLQAIEPSEIWYLPKQKLQELYQTNPKTHELMRRFWEDVVINLIQRFTSLEKDSAEKRYLDLLAKPAYMQRIPQKFLASFIGVTPTSLSRIRKNIR